MPRRMATRSDLQHRRAGRIAHAIADAGEGGISITDLVETTGETRDTLARYLGTLTHQVYSLCEWHATREGDRRPRLHVAADAAEVARVYPPEAA